MGVKGKVEVTHTESEELTSTNDNSPKNNKHEKKPSLTVIGEMATQQQPTTESIPSASAPAPTKSSKQKKFTVPNGKVTNTFRFCNAIDGRIVYETNGMTIIGEEITEEVLQAQDTDAQQNISSSSTHHPQNSTTGTIQTDSEYFTCTYDTNTDKTDELIKFIELVEKAPPSNSATMTSEPKIQSLAQAPIQQAQPIDRQPQKLIDNLSNSQRTRAFTSPQQLPLQPAQQFPNQQQKVINKSPQQLDKQSPIATQQPTKPLLTGSSTPPIQFQQAQPAHYQQQEVVNNPDNQRTRAYTSTQQRRLPQPPKSSLTNNLPTFTTTTTTTTNSTTTLPLQQAQPVDRQPQKLINNLSNNQRTRALTSPQQQLPLQPTKPSPTNGSSTPQIQSKQEQPVDSQPKEEPSKKPPPPRPPRPWQWTSPESSSTLQTSLPETNTNNSAKGPVNVVQLPLYMPKMTT